jgi:hypothetical protein
MAQAAEGVRRRIVGVFNASTSPLNTAPQITGPLATTLPTALAAVQKVRHARERASRLV